MLIDQYFNENGGEINFTRQQASDFAKKIADDFNPIHDTDAKRFCVPGDLLFSVILAKYGISENMKFTFSGMVTDETLLNLPEVSPHLILAGQKGNQYLDIARSGDNSFNQDLIDQLTRRYVNFSGHTFPHILIPLIKNKGVMINPNRPMVMYVSMLIEMYRFDLSDVELELDSEKTKLDVEGRRGSLCLAFNLKSGTDVIGRGEKNMILSGLQPYDQATVDQVITDYAKVKKAYAEGQG